MKCTQDNVTLLFFPDFSPVTAAKRKSLVPVLRSMTALGLQPFLAYPAVIKLRHVGEQRCFNSLRKAEDFVGSLSQSGTFAADLQGSGRAAAALSLTRREGLVVGMEEMVAGGIWMIARSLFFSFFFFLLSSWDSIYILFDTIVPLLVRLTPFFFLFFSGGD